MEIAALKFDTGERILLVPGGSNPHYAPTGHLIYGVDGTLRAVGFDPDRLVVTGDPVPVLEGVVTHGTGAAQFSFASDGSLVYLPGAAGGGRTLVWVDRQGNETPLDLQEARTYRTLRLSPDGTRLAVTVRDENDDVWVSELASGTFRRLTTDPATDSSPLWTADGERVVFASQREGSWGLFSMAWDGAGDAERLMVIEDAQDLQPYGWSPDGALLFQYLRAAGTSQDIGMLPVDGDGAWEPLLDTEADELAPAISPDGQWITYTSNRTGTREIYVQRFPELGGEQLVSTRIASTISSGRSTHASVSHDHCPTLISSSPATTVSNVHKTTAKTTDRANTNLGPDQGPPPARHVISNTRNCPRARVPTASKDTNQRPMSAARVR